MIQYFRCFNIIFMIVVSMQSVACPVCGFGQDGTQWAFLFTTGVLTFTPLLLIGTALLFMRRYIRQKKEEYKIREVHP